MPKPPARESHAAKDAAPAAPSQQIALSAGSPQSVWLANAPLEPVETAGRLRDKPRVTVAFPPCTSELLALIRQGDGDEITRTFTDYFKRSRHKIFGEESVPATATQSAHFRNLDLRLNEVLDGDALTCPPEPGTILNQAQQWPSECCLCSPCVTLDGWRNHAEPLPASGTTPGIRRLFAGDVVWLFYYERMGIQQILGAILDAFATTGRLPISNGSLDPNLRDDVTALILEVMVRQTKMGMASGVRDRGALYRTTVGWESPLARGLGLNTEVNAGFSTLFHRFIYNALEFYRDKRLSIAIQSSAAPRASVATLVTLSDTIDLLRKRFEMFDYGRNYYNALAGIVWTIAGMTIIRELRGTLGIPTAAFDNPYEFIPAAYDVLVLNRPFSRAEANRYDVHRACAINGRDILLDLEVINHRDTTPVTGELDRWLAQIEGKVEGYRTAYRNLTGTDLGASPSPPIEHQVPALA